MTRRAATAIVTAVLLALLAAASAAQAGMSTHYSGSLRDGGSWIADVPSDWNGTLLLYSHGYGTLAPADSPDPTTAAALLDRGYALAGSSYDPNGSLWALGSAVRDQFETLAAVKRQVLPSRPEQVLAFGTSMGGMISALEAESPGHRLDGALTTCGIVAGGIQLNNYQLDGEYAISRLLDQGQSVKLVRFASQAESVTTANELVSTAQTAQGTPQGRARLALAMAFLNVPTWAPFQPMPGPTDYAGQELAQYATEFSGVPFPVMLFIETGRQQIELAAGGSGAWTVGVSFERLLDRSPYRDEVRALYQAAGMDLRADLATLTAGADIRADRPAIRWLQQTSVPTGDLHVPELDLHTISDQLVPVQQERYYRSVVDRADSGDLLRQAFVQRQIHCNFTSAELVAGVQALRRRVVRGRWGDLADPDALQARALSLGLGDAAFIHYRPGRLSGDNGPFDPFTDGL